MFIAFRYSNAEGKTSREHTTQKQTEKEGEKRWNGNDEIINWQVHLLTVCVSWNNFMNIYLKRPFIVA